MLVVLGFLVLGGSIVLTIGLFHRGSSSEKQNVVVPRPSEARSDSIPPAPPPAPTLNPQPIPEPTALSATGQNVGPSLLYDESLSFADNLQRLREFCGSHANDPQLQQLLSQFAKVLFARAKGQLPAVTYALEHLDGHVIYRNIVLDCLIAADGSVSEKADLVWGIATDGGEPIETRRLATSLTSQLVDGKSRTDKLMSLLKDPDRDIVMLALQSASFQMDDRSSNLIKSTLLTSTDINVRIAAVDAIGKSTIADNQTQLLSIISEQQTSRANMFSDASLLKRRAIAYLGLKDSQTYDLVEHIALDSTEDPSVRAAAITKLSPKEFPGSANDLLGLLQAANSQDAVLLAATEDSLLTTPTPSILRAIQTKAEGLSDPQLRNFMIQRLKQVTNGGTQ